MTIKRKLVLGATTTFCALALTVPMTFAACPITDDCGNKRAQAPIVTPDNATCSKCKQNPCTCKKQNFFSGLFKKELACYGGSEIKDWIAKNVRSGNYSIYDRT